MLGCWCWCWWESSKRRKQRGSGKRSKGRRRVFTKCGRVRSGMVQSRGRAACGASVAHLPRESHWRERVWGDTRISKQHWCHRRNTPSPYSNCLLVTHPAHTPLVPLHFLHLLRLIFLLVVPGCLGFHLHPPTSVIAGDHHSLTLGVSTTVNKHFGAHAKRRAIRP